MPRKGGGKRRKRRTHVVPAPGTAVSKSPRSLVFRRGKVPAGVRDLVPDIRRMLMPNTALNLKEKRFNNIRDYVSVSAQLGISHFLIFSATDRGPYLRFCKVPQGPTLTFRLLEYSLAADVRSVHRRPVSLQEGDSSHAPLLVLNNFATAEKKADRNGIALTAEMFRRSFPAIDVKTAQLKTMRRVVLVDRDEDSDCIRLRHYAIRVQPAGLSRSVRKITVRGKVPKLANMTDVAELVDGTAGTGAFSSDSEMDDTPLPVTLPQPVKNLRRGANSVIRLVEVGPRLTLQLVKAEAGLCEGAVLYHRYKVKSKDEVADTERRIAARQALKRKRREDQEANVEKKHATKRAKRERHKTSIKQREKADSDEDPNGEPGKGNESTSDLSL
jgi:ribosome biogenesis protein SSF1/2